MERMRDAENAKVAAANASTKAFGDTSDDDDDVDVNNGTGAKRKSAHT